MILVSKKNTNIIISSIILSTLIILIFMTSAFSSEDKSNLQMVSIDCSKFSGISPETINTDDTSFLNVCINAINNGNGLQSINPVSYENFSYTFPTLIPTSIATGDEEELFMYGRYKTSGEVFLRCTTQNYTENFIGYYDLNDYMPSFPDIYPMNKEIFAFPIFTTTRFDYLVIPGYNRVTKVKSDNNYFNPSTDLTTTILPTVNSNPLVAKSADIFLNRLFISDENGYLIYSQASNYENFTASATEGGIIKIPASYVYNIKSTSSGLYIFCKNGIYFLYGDYDPTTWALQKIYDNSLTIPALIKNRDNTIYFTSQNQLFTVNGTTISRICNLPNVLDSYTGYFINNNFLAYLCKYGNECASYVVLYDIKNNTWSSLMNVLCMNSNKYYAIENMTINKLNDFNVLKNATGVVRSYSNNLNIRGNYIDKPIQIETNFNSLDGNISNLKYIRKIEIDALWNTRGFRSYEADNLVYDTCGWGIISLVYPDTKIAINNTMKISVISNKLTKTINRTYTDEVTLDENTQPNTIRTFTINNKSNEINTAVTSIKFRFSVYGDINIKAIRVYYIPSGSYNKQGKY